MVKLSGFALPLPLSFLREAWLGASSNRSSDGMFVVSARELALVYFLDSFVQAPDREAPS